MLSKFKVKGYKGFNDEISFDLEKHNDYQFNKEMIKNGIINKSIIYGKNGTGKSNIGLALFDIMFHLTDKNRNMEHVIQSNYLNLDGDFKNATFEYTFKIGNDYIEYTYTKENLYKLNYEKVLLNGEVIVEYNFSKPSNKIINIENAKTLNWEYNTDNLSVVKYICNNTMLDDKNPLFKVLDFVNGMLWFKSVDYNGFIGLKNESNALDKIIIDNKKVLEFQNFLKGCDIYYDFKIVKTDKGEILGVKKDKNIVSFESIISSGTKALWLFYCWQIHYGNVKFLFIDEFDATYHFELAAKVVRIINSKSDFQSVLTTHNTYLMSNKLSRPDCSFIIMDNKIKNLSSCTQKELREAHNVEKLYREGAFVD